MSAGRPILNYTTTIACEKSIAEIIKNLVAHGARAIMTEYGPDKKASALAFEIETPHGLRSFRLPARTDGVKAALEREHRRGRVPRRMTEREHAERVAWRILKDRVDVDMAHVDAGLVTVDEAMFANLVVRGGQTMYQVVSEHRLALPGPNGD
jgi:hypothetical protein